MNLQHLEIDLNSNLIGKGKENLPILIKGLKYLLNLKHLELDFSSNNIENLRYLE